MKNNKQLYYSDNQYKFGLFKDEWSIYGQKMFVPDFLDKKNKKIIELNGDIWHGNPMLYNENDHPHPHKRNMTAKEIWDKDEKRYNYFRKKEYDVLVI